MRRLCVYRALRQPGEDVRRLNDERVCGACLGKVDLRWEKLTQKGQLQQFLNVAKDYYSEWLTQLEEKGKEALAEVAESQNKLNAMLLPLGEGTQQNWFKKAETGDMLKRNSKDSARRRSC